MDVRGAGSPANKATEAALEEETVESAISEMVESRRKRKFLSTEFIFS